MSQNRTQHTPEPWEVAWDDKALVVTNREWDPIAGDLNSEADAARIVACVNACEGISDPSVVKEMVEVLRAVEIALDVPRNRMGRLEVGSPQQIEPLRLLAVKYTAGGAEDSVDQAVNVIRSLLARIDGDHS